MRRLDREDLVDLCGEPFLFRGRGCIKLTLRRIYSKDGHLLHTYATASQYRVTVRPIFPCLM
jgi:hypothetical protein